MNRRSLLKLLPALPFINLPTAIAEDKKNWLVVSDTKSAWECDWTTETGEVIKKGSYSKLFMRFATQAQACSFKAKLIPTFDVLVGKEKNSTAPAGFTYVRSGYRDAIRAVYKTPSELDAFKYDWVPDDVRIVCVENGEAYEIPNLRFKDFPSAWSFIDSLTIKVDDGESFSWQRLIQPFRRPKDVKFLIGEKV